VTFTSPANQLNSIGLADFPPNGWVVQADPSWSTPAASFVKISGNSAEMIWGTLFDKGTTLTAVYKVSVPAGTNPGTYSFANSSAGALFKYFIAGNGPITEAIRGDQQVSVIQ